jgi:hypothetical protein
LSRFSSEVGAGGVGGPGSNHRSDTPPPRGDQLRRNPGGGIARQALHRRLSSRGEELFDDAVRDVLSDREFDEEVLVEALHRAANIEDVFERNDALSDLPTTTELLVETLIAMPSTEEILTAPAELASNLVELRHTPRWWARNAWEDEDDWDE